MQTSVNVGAKLCVFIHFFSHLGSSDNFLRFQSSDTFYNFWLGMNASQLVNSNKVGNRSQGRPEDSLFNSYNTEV